ncbi:MAG: hypothetical protein HY299_02135 [Verrucomicrobia bacterium]|nr:hypothetical protein [Verrucomicrobiota bacterium]
MKPIKLPDLVRPRRLGRSASLVALLGLLFANCLLAGPNAWIGSSEGFWDIPANWSQGLPGTSDDVTIPVVENVLSLVICSDSHPTLRMRAQPLQRVEIQASEGVPAAEWKTLSTVTADIQGLIEFSDPQAVSDQVRFYRTIVKP